MTNACIFQVLGCASARLSSCLLLCHQGYHDQLVKDLGLPHKRKVGGGTERAGEVRGHDHLVKDLGLPHKLKVGGAQGWGGEVAKADRGPKP